MLRRDRARAAAEHDRTADAGAAARIALAMEAADDFARGIQTLDHAAARIAHLAVGADVETGGGEADDRGAHLLQQPDVR